VSESRYFVRVTRRGVARVYDRASGAIVAAFFPTPDDFDAVAAAEDEADRLNREVSA
jgi:hypothetical protein